MNAKEKLQEYFTKTMNHFIEQGKPATNDLGNHYLMADGRKCAIGIHIPDGHPAQQSPSFMSRLHEAHPDLADVAWIDTPDGIALSLHMQNVHDDPKSWDQYGFTKFGMDTMMLVASSLGLVE